MCQRPGSGIPSVIIPAHTDFPAGPEDAHLPCKHSWPTCSGKKGGVGRGQQKGEEKVRWRGDAIEEPCSWSSSSEGCHGKEEADPCVPQGVGGFLRCISIQHKEDISNSLSPPEMKWVALGSSSFSGGMQTGTSDGKPLTPQEGHRSTGCRKDCCLSPQAHTTSSCPTRASTWPHTAQCSVNSGYN